MRKTVRYISLLLAAALAISSCLRQEEGIASREDDAPQGTVKVLFNIAMPELRADLSTKAETRDSLPNLQTLHVAVFGGSGYLKQYTQATLVSKATTNYYGEATDIYTYQVELALTNSSIKVHFIGNGPSTMRFDYETNVIPALTKSPSDTRSDGYWQRITIPNGIRAKKYDGVYFDASHNGATYTDHNGKTVREGDYIDARGDLVTNGTGYVPSDETVAALSNIQLIRNFAKVAVTVEAGNFVLKSYSVINEPLTGTLAPYKGEWLDYLNYSDKSGHEAGYDPYEELLKVYPGVLPVGVTYDASLPSSEAFVTPDGDKVHAAGKEFYIYERPVPEEKPTFIIIYGTYTDDKGKTTDCYYKIDLMEKGVYLALFRNFQYLINIKTIKKVGKPDPQSAADGAGTGDVSSDINSATLTDISDGTVQLYVLETAPVIVGQQDDYELQYKFVYDVFRGDAAVNNYSEEWDTGQSTYCISFTGGAGDGSVIESYELDSEPGNASTSMYRTIHVKTKSPSTSTQKETLRITGTYTTAGAGGTTHTLYRDVVFTLLNVQKLSVKCIPSEVEQKVGEYMTVRITIPTGLPRSMFPLQFPIEAAAGSFDPRTDVDQNLPVKYGQTYQYTESGSSKTRLTSNSYYFVRTLSYAEYESAPSESDGTCYFDSYFKTIKAVSASDVFAGCLPPSNPDGSFKTYDYFEPDKDYFGNYTQRTFIWGTTPGEDFWEAGTTKSLVFNYDTAEKPAEIYVTLANLEIPAVGSNLIHVGGNRYRVDSIPNGGAVEIQVKVPDAVGARPGITLEATHYTTNSDMSGTVGKWVTKQVPQETQTGQQTRTTDVTFLRSDFSASSTSKSKGDDGEVTATITRGNYNSNNYIVMYNGGDGQIRFDLMDVTSNTVVSGNTRTVTSAPWISKVVFTYSENNYARGDVNPSGPGGYTNSGYSRNNTTGTWNGRSSSWVSFLMERYRTGVFNPTYYPNRMTRAVLTYSYTVTTYQTSMVTQTVWVTDPDEL